MQVRIPDRARPAGGSDRHLTVVDQRSGWEYDLWEVESKPSGGGELVTGYGGRTRIDGDGLGSDATAAHFGLLAGIIRAEELRRGRIDHALFLVADCDSGEFVYPARGRGAPCEDRTDAPAEGMRFQLDMSDAEIRALDAPRWKRAILRALARYGMFVGDTGGSPWDLEFESGSTYTSFGYPDRILRYAKRIGIPREDDGRYHFDLDEGDRLAEPPAGGRSVRERAELLTRGELNPAGRDSVRSSAQPPAGHRHRTQHRRGLQPEEERAVAGVDPHPRPAQRLRPRAAAR